MNEAFLAIPGYPNYALDTQGNVWSLSFRNRMCPEGIPRLKMLSPNKRTSRNKKRHYPVVPLYIDGRSKNMPIHRLVCLVHHGPPPADKPFALHRDDNYSNLDPKNLYWGTPENNAKDSIGNGTFAMGESQHNHKLTESDVREIRNKAARGANYCSLAKEYGVNRATTRKIVIRESWKHI